MTLMAIDGAAPRDPPDLAERHGRHHAEGNQQQVTAAPSNPDVAGIGHVGEEVERKRGDSQRGGCRTVAQHPAWSQQRGQAAEEQRTET